ncbi:unnamed protein product [Rhizophagus irregularis]|nr:unnamed protein product [Rhizophagus irregularis]
MNNTRDIRVVVAIDFGTTFSGFAYSNKINPETITNDTVTWGYPALAQEPPKKKKLQTKPRKPVELFKLHLANVKDDDKPPLPPGLDPRKAITDYLHEMNKLVSETLNSRWPGIRYPQQVRFVLSVPSEWHHDAKAIMRECMFNAGYLENRQSENLEFTTEPEAAAVYCMKSLTEHHLSAGSSFMIVDCGGASTERRCSAMFLVGGFSESQYLQQQIRRQFMNQVPIIAVPKHPIAAIERGALEYGLNMEIVQTRVLKFCYGVEVSAKWEKGDPPERRTPSGRIFKFHRLALRGVEVAVDQKFYYTAGPVVPNQTDMTFNIFITPDNNAKYCDEDGMKMLGKMKIDLPDPQRGKNRLVEFTLTFGTMEVKATAINKRTGQIYESSFILEF